MGFRHLKRTLPLPLGQPSSESQTHPISLFASISDQLKCSLSFIHIDQCPFNRPPFAKSIFHHRSLFSPEPAAQLSSALDKGGGMCCIGMFMCVHCNQRMFIPSSQHILPEWMVHRIPLLPGKPAASSSFLYIHNMGIAWKEFQRGVKPIKLLSVQWHR